MLLQNLRKRLPVEARFIEPCLPSPSLGRPLGRIGIHEIKHEGYRLMAQVQESRRSPREARGGRGAGLIGSLGAFFGAAFVRRADGRFIWLHCSASSASRVQVRATSSRISRTRVLGARSAI
jgi:hypothetical protein